MIVTARRLTQTVHELSIKRLVEKMPEAATLADAIRLTSEEIKANQDEVSSADQTIQYLKNAINRAKSAHKCATCDRGLSDAELLDFEMRNDRMIARLPEQAREARAALPAQEAYLNELRQAEMIAKQRVDLVEVTIPRDQAALTDCEKKLQDATANYKDADVKVKAIRDEVNVLVRLENAAGKLDEMSTRSGKLESEVRSLQGELQATGSTRTVDDAQNNLDRLTDVVCVKTERFDD